MLEDWSRIEQAFPGQGETAQRFTELVVKLGSTRKGIIEVEQSCASVYSAFVLTAGRGSIMSMQDTLDAMFARFVHPRRVLA
jgi:hypothetical protein